MKDSKAVYTLSKPKTAGQQIMDMLIYLVIVGVIYYAIIFILKIITTPFRILFTSDSQRFEANLIKAKAKVRAREFVRAGYDVLEDNPMYQYLVRFKYSPDKFKGDPENESYRVWFENLKKGTLLDTDLKWAPEVYVKNSNGTSIYNGDFLDYFSRQFDLHEGAGLVTKIKFMQTIQKFYPEFTPKFSVIPSELKDLYARLQSKELHNELIEVINGSGVPVDLAEGLVNETMTPAEVKASIRVMQKCIARKYGKAMCQFCVEHDYNPDLHEEHFSKAVNDILESTGNEEMALAMVRGNIKPEEITALVNRALSDSDPEDLLDNINSEFFRTMKTKTLKEVVGR